MKETDALQALASADRQILLRELVQTDGGVDETELARKIAADRHNLPPEAVSEEKVERARVRLYHVHLPLLSDLDIVDWEDGTVAFTDDERRDQLLDVASEFGDWSPADQLQRTSA